MYDEMAGRISANELLSVYNTVNVDTVGRVMAYLTLVYRMNISREDTVREATRMVIPALRNIAKAEGISVTRNIPRDVCCSRGIFTKFFFTKITRFQNHVIFKIMLYSKNHEFFKSRIFFKITTFLKSRLLPKSHDFFQNQVIFKNHVIFMFYKKVFYNNDNNYVTM